MIKVINSGSFDFDTPATRLIDVHSRGVDSDWLTKRAAVLTAEIRDIRPEKGFSYIHLISMGAMESVGCNRNGDGFNEKQAEFKIPAPKKGEPSLRKLAGGLVEYHPTFLTAHVFKHHQNKDPKKSIGEIKAAAYNQEMRRGELIIKVANDHPDWSADLQKLANGGDIPFSMAAQLPFDICSYCGNTARTRDEYCDHLSNHMSTITKTGEQVFAINDRPRFFDISKVFRPADRIAYSLQKVASSLSVVGGAELAEQLGLVVPGYAAAKSSNSKAQMKLAAAAKMAAIEKMIEGAATGADNTHLSSLCSGCPTENLSDNEIETLKKGDLGAVLKSLTDAKICLAVDDFLKLVMGSKADPISGDIAEVKQSLPGMYSRLCSEGEADSCAEDATYDGVSASIPRVVKDLISQLTGDHSTEAGPVGNRIKVTIIRGNKPSLQKSGSYKQPELSKSAEILAREYAKYQMSFVSAVGEDPFSTQLTVLSNYVRK